MWLESGWCGVGGYDGQETEGGESRKDTEEEGFERVAHGWRLVQSGRDFLVARKRFLENWSGR